jgi:hypothetical protein
MLIAEQLAKNYTFAKLCRLPDAELRSQVEAALSELEKATLPRP